MDKEDKIEPRLLTIRQVSSYWGVSPNTFRKLMAQGIAPGPINTPGLGRLLFDRLAQDAAIDARSTGRAA
jgi:predicted DNA-binding transcriptional regulator AlpA